MNHLKAPNIMILSEFEKDFNSIKSKIRALLGVNSYTIYNIKLSQLKSTPAIWIDNCKLLVTIESSKHAQELYEEQFSYMKMFLDIGGRILSLPSCLETACKNKLQVFNGIHKVLVYDSNYDFELKYLKEPLKEENTKGFIYSYSEQHWVSKIYLDFNEAEGYSESNDDRKGTETLTDGIFLDLFVKNFNLQPSDESMHSVRAKPYLILTKSKLLQSPSVLEAFLKDYTDKDVGLTSSGDEPNCNFNLNEFLRYLSTIKLGHVLFYTDVTTSTMNAISNLPTAISSVVAIARQQIQGIGNNRNEWLSPIGCAMFTSFINLNAQSFPTSRLCLLQYAAAIACVEAVLQTPGYEKVPLKIKWPNDVIYENSAKIGGILVKSSIMADNLTAHIGIGVNISNQYPTVCLNSIFESMSLDKWSSEKFIAKCLNRLEHHIEKLRNLNTLQEFIENYQKLWMHGNQNVHVEVWDEDVKVVGIDDYGYLVVERKNGETHKLQPDGNRFDMMRNLIVFK